MFRYFLRYSGDSGAGRVLAPRRADPRSFAVDRPSFFSACSCTVGWSGVHDRCQRVSQRRVAGRLPIRADPETIQRSVVSAGNSARRYWLSRSRSATARSPRSSSRIRSRNRYRWPVRSAIRRRRHPRKRPQQLPEPRFERIHQRPRCSPEVRRRPKAGHRRLHRVRRTSDHTGLPSTRVTASVLGDALGMVGRPVSTGLHDSCRLSSFLTRWAAGG